ncbi:MAG: hypothetical protein JNL98_40845 [Bryobacterales bacterium]|nr:hypothetical protein [Bryobacterales bacterium]
MKPNLDTLKKEMHEHLATLNIAVFRGIVADLHRQGLVLWDVRREPDFRKFVECGRQLGVKMMLLSHGELDPAMIEDAVEKLGETDMPRDEQRSIERRLKELKPFAGFTCSVELSFEYQNRFYLFDLRTEWYEELLELMDQIDLSVTDGEMDDEEDDSMYFSRN